MKMTADIDTDTDKNTNDFNHNKSMNNVASLPENNERLVIEYEFVQNLSNPMYLHYLAQEVRLKILYLNTYMNM